MFRRRTQDLRRGESDLAPTRLAELRPPFPRVAGLCTFAAGDKHAEWRLSREPIRAVVLGISVGRHEVCPTWAAHRSYEALCHNARVPAFMLHLRQPVRRALRDELEPERLERAIGVARFASRTG